MPLRIVCRGIALLSLLWLLACGGAGPRVGVLAPDGAPSFPLMQFAEPLDLEALPEGWYHREFRRHPPMQISFVERDGRQTIRLATHDSASMLFRHVDVAIALYPLLTWDWLIERGIDVPHDELTSAGDDHPARLYLDFETPDGDTHAMEIIWGNQSLHAGDWKHVEFFGLFSFPHYVAGGGAEGVGRWHSNRVDLTELYRELWGDPAGARLTELALFCDTDETGAESVAYFADVQVHQRPGSAAAP